jgi:translocation and assembly module TamB
MRAAARWLATVIATPIALALAALGLLQTRPGQDWLAGAIARAVSRPGFSVTIQELRGMVPFRMTAALIEFGDGSGIWLSLRNVALDLAPADLLARTLHIRSVEIGEIDVARKPSSAQSPQPPAQSLGVPHLPVAVVLDRLTVSRLSLAPAVIGEPAVATINGSAAVESATARAALDLHRIDGSPGNIALQMALTGTKPVLALRLQASEPTGMMTDNWLGRTDRLPLALSLDGDGPLADWHGRLTASAGALARADADIALASTSKTVLGISGKAKLAPLLPAELAPVVGDQANFSLHADFSDQTAATQLTIAIAAGTVTGDSSYQSRDGAIAAHLRVNVPHLALLSGVAGASLDGSANMNVGVTGSQSRPVATAELVGDGIGASGSAAEHIEGHVSATPTGPLNDAASRIAIAANGRIEGLPLPQKVAVMTGLGQDIDWSLAATTDRAAAAVDLTRFSARAGGLDLSGSGHLATGGQGIAAQVDFTGSANGMRTGIAAVDALTGAKATFDGAVRRDLAGVVALDHVALTGSGAKLSGNAQFDPNSGLLDAALTLDVPQLKPLGAALGTAIAGTVSAKVNARGPLERLRLQSAVEGRGITAGGAAIERFQISGNVADLSQRTAVIDGSFRALGLDGNLGLTAELSGNSEVAVPRLRLTAANSTIDGNLRFGFATGLVQGAVTARLPDLSRWSGLAGTPLGGSLDLSAQLAAIDGGQGLDLTVNGARLAAGAGAARAEIGGVSVTARLSDIWRAPSGTGRLSLTAAHFGAGEFKTVSATFASQRPGRFAFQGGADGRPLTVSFAGEGGLAPDGAELRLSRFAGSLGSDKFRLAQPLDLTRRGPDLAFSGLDLRLGSGHIAANGALRGGALALALNAVDLPIAAGAQLLGHPEVHGALSASANLSGTLRAPRGHIAVNARELSLSVLPHTRTPRLGLTVTGDWDGRAVAMQGQVTGLAGDRVAITGSLPLLLTPAPLGLSVPPQGRLVLRAQGNGDIGHLADLLPLGEDRLSGHFAADVGVGGTVAAPAASGQLRLAGARYENFATGAVLTDISADLVGDRDRFNLAAFSAADGASGTLKAKGGFVLSGASGPTAELSATLANFRVAARDEALITASGTISVNGPLSAPKAAASLTVDRAEINLPASLPPSVVVIQVTEIGGRAGNRPAPAEAAPELPVTLDITVSLPGPVLVRGHGLDSQWHGRLKITGTSAAPKITGTLVSDRGSVDLLGKSFVLTRGVITFDGSAKLDPTLDIVAEVSAADITAQVVITGVASAPKITLASTPPVPQDEILSRVLFNQGVGQINAGQGLQLAQAAATLTGGGPGVLDRLRGKLGLDWLRFGQGPAGAASPILNPSVVTPATSSSTAVSAGKYVMPGVSVGVTQGISPPTSRVTVEIELGHHITVDTEAGQNGGTGIGLNYNHDY